MKMAPKKRNNTDSKQVEQALRESEEKFSKAFRSSPDAVTIATLKDGKFIEVNDSFTSVTGYTRKEAINHSSVELGIWLQAKDRVRIIQKLKGQGSIRNEEFEFRTKLGEIRIGLLSAEIINIADERCIIDVVTDITERKQMEVALEESQSFSFGLLENSPNPIEVINLDTSIKYINPAFEKLTGFTLAEIAGTKIPHPWWPEEAREEITASLKETMASGGRRRERIFQKKNGERFNVEVNSAPIIHEGKRRYFLVNWTDITERKRAEERLRENERFTSSLLENAPNPIISINPDTSIRYVNPAFEKLTGYTLAEIAGKKIPHPWWPEENKSEIKASIKQTLEIGGRRLERMFQKKNGEFFWVDMNMVPIVHDGTLKYHLANWDDITERKRMEEEIKAHRDSLEELVRMRTSELSTVNQQLEEELAERKLIEKELIKARDDADAANQAKSEFLARMSHEIRTPIHGVMGTIDLVLDSQLEKDQRQYLNMAMASAESLLNVINDILDLSKIEARQSEPEREDFDLRATLEETLETLAVTAYRRGIEITCQIPPFVPTALVGDEGHLRQILINLLSNAVKFTEHGEVAVSVDSIADKDTEVEFHFAVRDTGIGISPDKQKQIFEAFQQADGSINRKYGGTGLGLTISQRLISQMGGSIWLESAPGEGSTFHFTGKFAKQAPAEYPDNDRKAVEEINGFPVLIIDDNASNRVMLKDLLVNWGAKVTEVDSGPAALKMIENARDASSHFCIILLDKTMPEMDGFAVSERILSDSEVNSTVVMMLPPHSVSDDFSRCQELGISSYLIKPVKESELLKTVMSAMGMVQETVEETDRAIPDAKDLPHLRILVAEDNTTSQLIAKKTLEKMGHTVEIANNGAEASRMVEESEYDLVLMDAEMPIMDGLEATHFIRKREKRFGRHIPIIAMTAYAMKEDREKCLEAGMDGYLSKPARPDELNAIIKNLFSLEKEPTDVPPAATTAAPAVDMNAAMQVFGDDKELLGEAVALFIEEDYPEQIRQIKEGIKSQDASTVKIAAHSIKGAARSLGGLALGDVAQRLEEIGREGDLTDADKTAEVVEAEFKRFADFFAQTSKHGVND